MVEDLRPSMLRALLSHFGLPARILSATRRQLMARTTEEIADGILGVARTEKIDAALDWLSKDGHHLITLADEAYPGALFQCSDPPPMLYVIGDPTHLNRPSLAVIGSRNATPQGLANARSFAKVISDAGLTVVSGLALGIDTAAHFGALAGTGSTVAVLGCGADIVYPRANAKLVVEIEKSGAIISEFPLGTAPIASNFPRRNRIISGLSSGCLVVEAALASGSLITAKLALEQGREVFAIPGSIHSPLSRGCHSLIKQGAKLVETAQDILLELNFKSDFTAHNILKSGNPLLQYLGYDPCDKDTLQNRSGLTTAEVSAMLLALELEGRVGCMSGGLYQRLD